MVSLRKTVFRRLTGWLHIRTHPPQTHQRRHSVAQNQPGEASSSTTKEGGANLKDLIADARAQEEAERIMRQMEDGAQREAAEAAAGGPKYMPTTEGDDPIVQALRKVVGVDVVESESLLCMSCGFDFV